MVTGFLGERLRTLFKTPVVRTLRGYEVELGPRENTRIKIKDLSYDET